MVNELCRQLLKGSDGAMHMQLKAQTRGAAPHTNPRCHAHTKPASDSQAGGKVTAPAALAFARSEALTAARSARSGNMAVLGDAERRRAVLEHGQLCNLYHRHPMWHDANIYGWRARGMSFEF
jgi:hypothetical protein